MTILSFVSKSMKPIFLYLLTAFLLVSSPVNAGEEFVLRPKDILRVYDGDTIYVTIPNIPAIFGNDLGIRLVGIDTPESRSTCTSAEDRAAERALAMQARLFLENLIFTSPYIEIRELSRDKYFRLDARIFAGGVDVSELMIQKGYAVPYDGGTKVTWCGKR